jgi:hypothetical protein
MVEKNKQEAVQGRLKRIKGFWSSESDYYILRGDNLCTVE